jgi:hypothetical protein
MDAVSDDTLKKIAELEVGLEALKKDAEELKRKEAFDTYKIIKTEDLERVIELVTRAQTNFVEYKNLVDAQLAKFPAT